MSKGEATKLTILDTALRLVRKLGFEAVSINQLAKAVGMSKSGLFAHFNSKESMHIMILDYAAESFSKKIFAPALKVQRGEPRLRAIIENWVNWYGKQDRGSCPFVAAAVDYDAKPGQVKDRLQFHLRTLMSSISRSVQIAKDENHFHDKTDPDKAAYEIYSMILGYRVYRGPIAEERSDEFFQSALDDFFEKYSNNSKAKES